MKNHRQALLLLALLIPSAGFSRAALAQSSEGLEPPPPPVDDSEDQAPPPPPQAAQPPQTPPTEASFDQQLAPYGHWVTTPDYGRVWVPDAESSQPDWQPYTQGHWVYTSYGWSFVPDQPWGWVVFHYGRWGWAPALGWYWVPGFVWAPAWVSWRYSNGHIAWAPFAPRGYRYGRNWPGWVAVPRASFTRPIVTVRVPRAHVGAIVRTARPAPSIRSVPERGRTYGPPHVVHRREERRR
jgi:hypothetical protein